MPAHTSASVHVIGAGGIGCAVGYALRATDVPVTFVDADAGKVAWGKEHGVQVDRRRPLQAEFVSFNDWRPVPDSLVLLCTKCYDNRAVLDRLSVNVTLLPIQNGFDRDLDGLPAEGIASFVSECRPGQTSTRITRRGKLQIGPRRAGGKDTTTRLARLLDADILAGMGIRFDVVEDILPYKYTKLMYNAAISPLAASTGLDNGQLLSVRPVRRLFFELIRENHGILRAAGIPLGKIGPFHPDTVQRILSKAFVANALAWAFYPTLRGTYCSMSQDLPKGKTEIDYYNRHLIEVAGEHPCPLNRRIYDVVKRMEREHAQTGLHVVDELSGSTSKPSETDAARRLR
ncbi:MAG: ketopantoate reductase family protein [Gemmataceae bacterium]